MQPSGKNASNYKKNKDQLKWNGAGLEQIVKKLSDFKILK